MTTSTVNAFTLPADSAVELTGSRRQLTELEARKITTEIQRASVRLWVLVTEAHDRKVHSALGYATWDDYVRTELKMSPSRSYQLLDTGHVMKEMASAGADLEDAPIPTARVVAKVKDRLPEVRKSVRIALKDGGDLDAALRTLARQTTPTVPAPRTGDHDAATEPAKKAGRPPTLVTCPACEGSGKVSRTLAGKTRAWLKRQG